MSIVPGGRFVHRSVHERMSRQYQRMSAQALPPSATRRSTGKWIPQIQQDLITVGAAWAGISRS